ncbi:hypothetical protein FACS189499_01900 [Clostridia bacterium]|nr:hypothetical protein FACS189499_01900 [Clostridia bacterium]
MSEKDATLFENQETVKTEVEEVPAKKPVKLAVAFLLIAIVMGVVIGIATNEETGRLVYWIVVYTVLGLILMCGLLKPAKKKK